MDLTLLPQLKLVEEGKGGASPNTRHRFKRLTTFVDKYRAYQWTQGFDLKPSPISNADLLKLVCCDDKCTFQVTAHSFADQPGFQVLSTPFQPTHHHAPPYEPLSLEAENTRRLTPLPASLHAPPREPSSPLLPHLYAVDPGLLAYVPTLGSLGLLLKPEELYHIEDEDIVNILKHVEMDEAAKLALRLVFARGRNKGEWDVGEKQTQGFARWATEVLARKKTES